MRRRVKYVNDNRTSVSFFSSYHFIVRYSQGKGKSVIARVGKVELYSGRFVSTMSPQECNCGPTRKLTASITTLGEGKLRMSYIGLSYKCCRPRASGRCAVLTSLYGYCQFIQRVVYYRGRADARVPRAREGPFPKCCRLFKATKCDRGSCVHLSRRCESRFAGADEADRGGELWFVGSFGGGGCKDGDRTNRYANARATKARPNDRRRNARGSEERTKKYRKRRRPSTRQKASHTKFRHSRQNGPA